MTPKSRTPKPERIPARSPSAPMPAAPGPMRNKIRPPAHGTNFNEAVGKVVAYINCYNRPDDYQTLEVGFTDGTLFSFDLVPQVRVKVQYETLMRGNSEVIKDYGTVPEEHEDGEE